MSDMADIGDLEHFPEGWRYRLSGQSDWSQGVYKCKTHADQAMTDAWANQNKTAAGIGGLQGIGNVDGQGARSRRERKNLAMQREWLTMAW